MKKEIKVVREVSDYVDVCDYCEAILYPANGGLYAPTVKKSEKNITRVTIVTEEQDVYNRYKELIYQFCNPSHMLLFLDNSIGKSILQQDFKVSQKGQ